MKITVLHGQMHQGSTYHLTKMVLDRLSGPDTAIREFFMPKDMPAPCVGCNRCFLEGEENCPQADAVRPVAEALEEADLIVLESPCYVFGMTGQLKILLDHLGYRWMPHRPHPKMFRKVGLAVSTAAGGGADKVVKALARHLFFWGVPAIHRFSANVQAAKWDEVKGEKRKKLEKRAVCTAAAIRRQIGRARPGVKTCFLFYIMRSMHKKGVFSPTDHAHWERNGWLDGKTPWKDPA
ncbi:flavodoxin family protein [Ethanoligenens harbinense]|uniref:NADPH-dependent FMN reductase n=1 Tax=Ethanoligenens harbinense (strain DSM 18485 / JCM 12961 / CGMCC 1.5033 / YUAN-3) TaxID=663278 RepID=E6U7X3_ETHHY|nr:NAD(P)H-dependent oxidoreductase [Ethanoligenens harbinense]ADU25905.1 NADPH-dependent FMN reductase [Ethanoligenens harbinense YUAN-3]AVQ95061.1 NADPH-dependent oxidoreductase [Ethanoligenens harbinense YUAN-3]AYF37752.1 NADPH-dependent oxidoreductase [Ethanoligenens harbinense]AYF40473.1 NADPH-dependent oxidoreductase [Ethanoligenens harbinense]QCN91307.1 NADPH-dependent oxidoreductase [Ethanoligenens harbinense]